MTRAAARRRPAGISIKSAGQIEKMRRAGQVVARSLGVLRGSVRPGITTAELDRLAQASITGQGAIPSFLGYGGFPASVCISVNDEVVHGIPGPRVIREGDLVSIDLGAIVEGFHADAALTVPVGAASEQAARLLWVTEQALWRGIEQARAGNRVSDVSRAIQQWVEGHGCSVVRELVGHGIGSQMHEPPQVPNFVEGGSARLKPGMALAIEPMVNQGDWEVVRDPNGWTYRTRDGSLSAHFEHTVVVTEGDPEVLTALK